MIPRVRLAGVAVVLLLATASVVRAQAPDTTTAKREGALPGRGSIGGQVGGSWFFAEKDYSKGAMPRMTFVGHFRYVVNDGWQWQVSPYFTWSAYAVGTEAPFVDPNYPEDGLKKDAYLSLIAGGSGQLQKVWTTPKSRWHAGLGPAVFWVAVENHRKILRDPVTDVQHKGAYFGASAEVGHERFLKSLPNTSIEWTFAYQAAFAKRDDQFPSGFNSSVHAIEIRLGSHYYFDFRKPKTPDARKTAPKK